MFDELWDKMIITAILLQQSKSAQIGKFDISRDSQCQRSASDINKPFRITSKSEVSNFPGSPWWEMHMNEMALTSTLGEKTVCVS